MLRKSVTQQYPEVKPALPPRSRGVIALVEENCTSCMLCARECPDWCIYIDSHKETLPAPEGGRARQRNVLDRFAIDFALCMYCGICIEVCPFDALFWSPEFEYAEGDIRNLLHEKEQLAAWAPTVPPPPAHEAGAEPPKELSAAAGPARGAASAARTARAGARAAAAEDKELSTGTAEAGELSTGGAAAGPEASRPAITGTGDEREKTAEPAGQSPAERQEPAEQSADTGETAGRRPRRPLANVRGIKPPGALPKPDPETQRTDESSDKFSTGEAEADELSTGSDDSSTTPESPEQTSPAAPRKRRMTDPRSIRPPGEQRPDDTRES
ncbi:4Fe-4S binding protein [Nonomuraea sp. NBC_01738]|uniref:4Fe-4S binding protein n=1 Tax=Nonomuraea sp. NBC_01738 TaxID=2976003 RepID=UPI002E1075A9|nr:4Fe-4S binding protein [Nonomuraea sp. NBC_01738]